MPLSSNFPGFSLEPQLLPSRGKWFSITSHDAGIRNLAMALHIAGAHWVSVDWILAESSQQEEASNHGANSNSTLTQEVSFYCCRQFVCKEKRCYHESLCEQKTLECVRTVTMSIAQIRNHREGSLCTVNAALRPDRVPHLETGSTALNALWRYGSPLGNLSNQQTQSCVHFDWQSFVTCQGA